MDESKPTSDVGEKKKEERQMAFAYEEEILQTKVGSTDKNLYKSRVKPKNLYKPVH